jgi:hypothetical protein
MEFRNDRGEIIEDCLYTHTQDASYEAAYEALVFSVSQYVTKLAELAKVDR